MLQKLRTAYYRWLGIKGYTADHFYEVPVEEDILIPSHIDIDRDIQPNGHVLKTSAPVYTPNQHRRGGRVVKNMPKQLRKIRDAQAKVEADE